MTSPIEKKKGWKISRAVKHVFYIRVFFNYTLNKYSFGIFETAVKQQQKKM